MVYNTFAWILQSLLSVFNTIYLLFKLRVKNANLKTLCDSKIKKIVLMGFSREPYRYAYFHGSVHITLLP